MVIAVYILIILASVTQSATTKLFNQNCSHSAVFNAIKSCTALVLFALIAAFDFTFHLPTVFFGFRVRACWVKARLFLLFVILFAIESSMLIIAYRRPSAKDNEDCSKFYYNEFP